MNIHATLVGKQVLHEDTLRRFEGCMGDTRQAHLRVMFGLSICFACFWDANADTLLALGAFESYTP